MAWQTADLTVPPGKYLAIDVTRGVALWDIDPLEAQQRIADMAVGWTPIQVINTSNMFGLDQVTRVLGRTTDQVESAQVANQVSTAYNSFWGIFGVATIVRSSDNLNDPLDTTSDPWASAITAASYAIIIVGVAYAIYKIKDVFK